jgi:hypothetical protein
MTSKAHSGFDGGVQNHSQGEHYPNTVHYVGGVPRPENHYKFVVSNPCGVSRFCYGSKELQQELLDTFVEAGLLADEAKGISLSRKIVFELALHGLEKQGKFTGWEV